MSAPLVLPLARSLWRVTSGYGWRNDPKDGTRRLHKGVDIGVPVGTALYAPMDAEIVETWADDDLNGNAVGLRSLGDERLYVSYAHMDRTDVRKGDKVRAGQIVGLSGNTGKSTGPHVHIRTDAAGVNVDPMTIFDLDEDIDPARLPASVTRPRSSAAPLLVGLLALGLGWAALGAARRAA